MLKELLRLLSAFIPAIIVCVAPVLLVFLDSAVFAHDCDECGIVEISQSVMLLAIVLLMGMLARRYRDRRGGLVLVTAFFLDMLIREQDQIFELVLPHGFWALPCAIVTILALLWSWKERTSVLPAFRHIRDSRCFPALALGLFTVICYARIFGSKYIWRMVVDGSEFYRTVKHVVEEGSELFGYTILLAWAVCYFKDIGKEN